MRFLRQKASFYYLLIASLTVAPLTGFPSLSMSLFLLSLDCFEVAMGKDRRRRAMAVGFYYLLIAS